MTINDIKSACTYHHSAAARGYLSRVKYAEEPRVEPYKGRFGEGYKLVYPRWDTTQYVRIEYWTR